MIDPTTKAKLCERLRKQALNQSLITGEEACGNRMSWILLRHALNDCFGQDFHNSVDDNRCMMLFLAQLFSELKTDAVKEPRATYTFPVNTKGEYSRICWNCDNCCPAPHGGNDAWCVLHGMWVDLGKDACAQFERDREIAEAGHAD